jgi:hypothetical protein
MKSNQILYFLAFAIVVICVVGWWASEKFGSGVGAVIGAAGFVVFIIFAQQILSQNMLKNTLNILVEYDKAQADVEKERVKVTVQQMAALKEVIKVEAGISGEQYRQLQVAAQKMYGLLSEAEIAKVRAEMMVYGVNQLPDKELDLDG